MSTWAIPGGTTHDGAFAASCEDAAAVEQVELLLTGVVVTLLHEPLVVRILLMSEW